MSRENTPTDNAIAEQFMRTFKEYQVNGKTFEQTIQESLILESKSYRSITNLFIKSLNKIPNRKTLLKSSERHDNDVLTLSLLMREHKRGNHKFLSSIPSYTAGALADPIASVAENKLRTSFFNALFFSEIFCILTSFESTSLDKF